MLPIENLNAYVEQHALFRAEDKVLLAVSGGKDSVLMVHLFKAAGYRIGIAHCNFNLRGEESQRDERFVKLLALNLDLPFYVMHFDTKEYAQDHKISTQMAARELRYRWFEKIRYENDYQLVAVAQHGDDAIETVLLNLTRGTGIAGLHGILPKRDQLIRPLLFLSRAEIDELVAENNIDYVEDSSNATTNYARNKIRQHVIPVLKEINPSLEKTFSHNIQRFAETEMVLDQAVALLRDRLFKFKDVAIHIDIAGVSALKPKKLLLFELMRPFGFSESVIDDLLLSLNSQSGTSFFSESHRILINREDLIITEIVPELVEKVCLIHHQDKQISYGNQRIMISHSDIAHFERNELKAFVDEKKLIYPLVLRGRQGGDKFMPIGMKGFKKLSDFLINEKVPLTEKDHIPILVNGNGEIIWIVGMRQDDRYKITGVTKQVVVFELQKLIDSH